MGRARGGSALATVGWTLLALAGVVVLFVGYQLWGTGVVQAHRQDTLRHQFEESLARQRTADAHRDLGGSSAAALTPEPAIGDPVGTLVIPEIGVDQVIVEGVGSAQLAFGPGHYPGTPLPGQRGNAGIAGHRTTHGRPFYDLNALVAGDPITVTTLQGTFHYLVIRSEVVAPTDLTVLVHSAAPELTLTTCTPRYSAAQRLVVVARLVSSPVARGRPATTSGTGHAPEAAGQAGEWGWLVLWGLACVALVGLVVVVSRRRPSGRAWVVPVVATVPALVLLYFFFGAVNAVLPATY